MDISINTIENFGGFNQSELLSAACTAKELAIREIRDIDACWGNTCDIDHDRMMCNLHKAVDILRDVVAIKATYLMWVSGVNGSTTTTLTRETRPFNHPNTSVERAAATIS